MKCIFCDRNINEVRTMIRKDKYSKTAICDACIVKCVECLALVLVDERQYIDSLQQLIHYDEVFAE